MAVPKKRTSKAKTNKRKTAWKQKAIKIFVTSQSRRIHGKSFPVENVIGFRPELRFKYQPDDKLRSKKKQFMQSEEKVKLLKLSKSRLDFNPQSKEKLKDEINSRFAQTSQFKEEKARRIEIKQNQKQHDKEQKKKAENQR